MKELINRQVSFESHKSRYKPFQEIPFHYHDIYEVFILLSPDLDYVVGKNIYKLQRASVLLLNPFDLHRPILPKEGNYERLIILFQREFIDAWCHKEVNFLAPFDRRAPSFNHHRILSEETLQNIITLMNIQAPVESLALKQTLMNQRLNLLKILLILHGEYDQGSEEARPENHRLSPLLEYIDTHLNENLSLGHLASQFGFTANTLNRQFKKLSQFTVKQYILHSRIQKARELLSHGCSVTETAYQSGFGDLSHFIRIFHKKTGMTPGEMQREL